VEHDRIILIPPAPWAPVAGETLVQVRDLRTYFPIRKRHLSRHRPDT